MVNFAILYTPSICAVAFSSQWRTVMLSGITSPRISPRIGTQSRMNMSGRFTEIEAVNCVDLIAPRLHKKSRYAIWDCRGRQAWLTMIVGLMVSCHGQ